MVLKHFICCCRHHLMRPFDEFLLDKKKILITREIFLRHIYLNTSCTVVRFKDKLHLGQNSSRKVGINPFPHKMYYGLINKLKKKPLKMYAKLTKNFEDYIKILPFASK